MVVGSNQVNKNLSSATADCVFRIVKLKRRYLVKMLHAYLENVSNYFKIIACFYLHNFCQINGETCLEDDILNEIMHQGRAQTLKKDIIVIMFYRTRKNKNNFKELSK